MDQTAAMTVSLQTKLNKLLRYLPAWYFLILGLVSYVYSALGTYTFTWFDAIIMLVLALPAIFHNKWVYGVFGTGSAIVWTMFLLQVLIWFNKEPPYHEYGHHYTTTDFIVGFLLCSTSAFFSIALLYKACYWQGNMQANQ